jgi:hypothetical protein
MVFPEDRVNLSLFEKTLDMPRRILHDQLMGAGSSYALLPLLQKWHSGQVRTGSGHPVHHAGTTGFMPLPH